MSLKKWKVIRSTHGGLAVVDGPTTRPILAEAYSPDACFAFIEKYSRRRGRQIAAFRTLLACALVFAAGMLAVGVIS